MSEDFKCKFSRKNSDDVDLCSLSGTAYVCSSNCDGLNEARKTCPLWRKREE